MGEPTEEEIEAVAESLWRSDAERMGFRRHVEWSEILPADQEQKWRPMARAAIKALTQHRTGGKEKDT